ncbi:DNA-protecting protein DprA [filamentous cyanobacterium LEGE 11480]|uniref:DNA-protecting protein DprA n=2 Tax=Romeriopsis TaxID=2992131 RepID=A0A928VPY0_9CYAN|nr:DNA-protecting protein DprA [Romeriopsis navalis LEGE 11480]
MEVAWDASIEELQTIEGIGPKLSQIIHHQRQAIVPDHLLDGYLEANPSFITPADPEYPNRLWEIADPPVLLHYQGDLELLKTIDQATTVALVGTRKPSDYGQRWTRRLSRSLSQHGWTIVSGLAAGIDAQAHQSCLEVQGATIGVLGTGIDVVYPRSNQKLYDQMAQVGLILSEYPAGTAPNRTHFPERNRIVAGLCRATLVMEAGHKSGALITARLANEYGRDVYALAGSLDNPEAAGSLNLIHQGAQIITGEARLLESLGTIPTLDQLDLFDGVIGSAVTPSQPMIQLPPELHNIWQTIANSPEPVILDHIVEGTGLPTGNVLSGLLELELMGVVEQQAGMRYQTAS